MKEKGDEKDEERSGGGYRGSEEERPAGKYRGDGSLGDSQPHRHEEQEPETREGDLEETLDRERHGSGEYDPEERYGRRDVTPNREQAGPGDESEPDTAEGEPKRGRSPRKQDPESS